MLSFSLIRCFRGRVDLCIRSVHSYVHHTVFHGDLLLSLLTSLLIYVFVIDLYDRLNRKSTYTYYTLAIHKKHRCVKQGPLSKCGQTPAANDHWKIA